jgi:hypothetical protein
MCLFSGDSYKGPEEVVGWKVYLRNNSGKIMSYYCNLSGSFARSEEMPLRKWLQAVKTAERFGNGFAMYETGFHVFSSRASARKFKTSKEQWRIGKQVICKVRLRKIRLVGIDESGHRTLVGDEMMILPEKVR